MTDNNGATADDTRTLTVRGPYNAAVIATAGLIDYWRLGESLGHDPRRQRRRSANATAQNGVTLGAAGPLTFDPNTARQLRRQQRRRLGLAQSLRRPSG